MALVTHVVRILGRSHLLGATAHGWRHGSGVFEDYFNTFFLFFVVNYIDLLQYEIIILRECWAQIFVKMVVSVAN